MARIVYSTGALEQLERLIRFLQEQNPATAIQAAAIISSAINTLQQHPLIGRNLDSEIRELVISYGKTGYIALYRHLPAKGEVRILGIRHQRELDYPY